MSMTAKQRAKFIEKAEKAPAYSAGYLRQLRKERREMLIDIVKGYRA